MNTSYKCNCCRKENVCKFKEDYIADCQRIPQHINGKTTEVSIKCNEFLANQPTVREVKGGIEF